MATIESQLASVWDVVEGLGVEGTHDVTVLRPTELGYETLLYNYNTGVNGVGELQEKDEVWLFATGTGTVTHGTLKVNLFSGWNNFVWNEDVISSTSPYLLIGGIAALAILLAVK